MPRASDAAHTILAILVFAALGTANAGGYRFGVSDQAFYIPAVSLTLDPMLFPHDRALLLPQMKLWLGGPLIATLTRAVGGEMTTSFALLYGVTLTLLAAAAVQVVRALGGDRLTVAACLALLSIRHQITKTGANSIEGYMHPRMLAFACGLAGLAAIIGNRFGRAAIWIAVALVIHTTTGLWFVAIFAVAAWWRIAPARWRWWLVAGVGSMVVLGLAVGMRTGSLTVMDEEWLRVFVTKEYLFPARWPAYAWLVNLGYPLLIVAIYRRRRARGVVRPGEPALVAGLVGLVAGFLVCVPLTASRLAIAIQLQANRVFWVLDAVAICYLGWWLLEDAGRRWSPRLRAAVAAVLVLASGARGYYVIAIEADRQLVQPDLPATAWTDAMRWLRLQPVGLHVLADPEHSLVYGASIRVAAVRDTLLDLGKDSAMALYDRAVAMRVADRVRALDGFASLTGDNVRALATRYDLDVMVDTTERTFDFPVAYRNDRFVIYRLR